MSIPVPQAPQTFTETIQVLAAASVMLALAGYGLVQALKAFKGKNGNGRESGFKGALAEVAQGELNAAWRAEINLLLQGQLTLAQKQADVLVLLRESVISVAIKLDNMSRQVDLLVERKTHAN